MSFSINIDLTDQDLAHFAAMRDAANKATLGTGKDQIVEAAMQLLVRAQDSKPPEFIQQRLLVLDTLIAMVRDEGWSLSEEDAAHVHSALAYFAAPADAIPDSVPVLGFLDDAIMIELCTREMCHEIDAYNDFCDFRQRESERQGIKPETVGRADWLSGRREELQDRMRRRRSREGGRGIGTGYGSSSGYGSAKSYCAGWRPGVFKTR